MLYVGKEVFSDVKKSSNRKSSNKHGNRDGLEADDEQSDWPSYEKTPGHQQRASKKMETELSEAFSVVPWWEKDGVDLIRKQSYYDTCLQNSNYEIMNRSEDAEKTKEFDEILNGALGLMSSKAKDIYHTKMKSIVRFLIFFDNQTFYFFNINKYIYFLKDFKQRKI